VADIELWIDGQPPRKSNSRRIAKQGGKTRVIKSRAALDWTEAAILQVPADARRQVGSAERPLAVTMNIFYTSHRPDLSGELVLDMLQRAGVIKDDRYVYHLHLFKHFSKNEPGVLIRIETIP